MEKAPRVPALAHPLEVKREYSSDLDGAYLYTLEGRDDVIVRPLNWRGHLAQGRFHPDWNGESISATEFAMLSKQHFDKLERYDVRVPVAFIVADSERNGKVEDEVFAIVDDVKRDPKPDRAALAAAFASMRKGLLRYYTDTFESGQSYLADLFNDSQYVFGKRRQDASDQLYLVDVEPFIYRGNTVLARILDSMVHSVDQEWGTFKLQDYESISHGFSALLDRVRAATI